MKFFIIYIFLIIFNILAENEINLDENFNLKFSELKKYEKNINFKIDPIFNTGEIFTESENKFRFLINSNYLSVNNKIYKSDYNIYLYENDLFIPSDLFKLILYYGFKENFSLTLEDNKYYYQIYRKDIYSKENINLKNIVIDPGHGGRHLGAIGLHDGIEKDINLEISKLLESELQKSFNNLNIFKIRDRDQLVELEERPQLAGKYLHLNKNSIFISIHCNSVNSNMKSPSGFEVYHLDQKENTENLRQKMVIDSNLINKDRNYLIQKIHSELYNSMVQRRSINLATSINLKLSESLGNRLKSRGVKRSEFLVLRKNLMPSILLEIGFITNNNDLKIIANKDMQKRIVKGIIDGLKYYAERKDF